VGVTRFATVAEAPGRVAHCVGLGLALGAPLLLLGWWLVLRRVPVGASPVGGALGAAAGLLAALVLHLVCPYGGAHHVTLGHASGIALLALAGALPLRRAR
jgi:hypothetical protein